MKKNIKIEEFNGGFIILYKNFYLYKISGPTYWHLDDEISQIYTTKEFAENDIRSLKMFITRNYNKNFEEWEQEEIERLNRR